MERTRVVKLEIEGMALYVIPAHVGAVRAGGRVAGGSRTTILVQGREYKVRGTVAEVLDALGFTNPDAPLSMGIAGGARRKSSSLKRSR